MQAKNPEVKIFHESHETALKRFVEKGDFIAWLKVEWDLGNGTSVIEKKDLKNGLWQDWRTRGVEEFL